MKKLITLLTSLFALSLQAANWYARPTANGAFNGTDWNNSWSITSINWTTVQPGDTVWLAGGSYGSALIFNKSGTASSQIMVRRPLITDSTPTNTAGWSSAFTNQITWGALTPAVGFNSQSYVTFDARGLNGALAGTYGAFQNGAVTWASSTPSSPQHGVRLIGITLVGPMNSGTPSTVDCKAILTDTAGASTGPIDSYIGYCIVNGWTQGIETLGDQNTIIERNQIVNIMHNGSSGGHPDVVFMWGATKNFIYRYNYTYNVQAEGIFCEDSALGPQNGNFYIYGNVDENGPQGNGNWAQLAFCKAFVYNNSFIGRNVGGGSVWGISTGGNDLQSGSIFYNNIYYNSATGGKGAVATSSHELSTAVNQFVGASGIVTPGNYHLTNGVASIQGGTPIPSTAIELLDGLALSDPDGNIYGGTSNVWDQGAYVFTTNNVAPVNTNPPSIFVTNPPTSFLATNFPLMVFSGSATDDVAVVAVHWTNALTHQSGIATLSIPSGSASVNWSASVSNYIATNVYTFTAIDSANNNSSSNVTATFTNTLPLTFTFTTQTNYVTSSQRPPISFTVTSPYQLNQVGITNSTTSDFSFNNLVTTTQATFNATFSLVSGTNNLIASGRDIYGTLTTFSFYIVFSTTVPPIINVTSGTNYTTFVTNQILVAGNVYSPYSLSNIVVTNYTAATGSRFNGSSTNFSLTFTNPPLGSNYLGVIATDTNLNVATFQFWVITTNNTTPGIPILIGLDNPTFTVTNNALLASASGWFQDTNTVTFLTLTNSAIPSDPGVFSFPAGTNWYFPDPGSGTPTSIILRNGTNILTAFFTDSAGITRSTNFTVFVTAPFYIFVIKQ